MHQLADAEVLLPTSPRNAAYLAGYAIEFMLKARYCVLRGWETFPASTVELKARNARDGIVMPERLFVHDLDDLLRLSNNHSLRPSSFHRIDWNRACDWTEEIRYRPSDAVSLEDATSLIAEVRKVVEELFCFEVVAHLLRIEIALSNRFGLFHCFAYVIHPETKKWHVLVSWVGRSQDEAEARMTELNDLIAAELPADLHERVSEVVYLEPTHPVLQSLYSVLSVIGGGIAHSPRSMLARNVVVGLPFFPDGFVITGGFWSQQVLETAWASAAYMPANTDGRAQPG